MTTGGYSWAHHVAELEQEADCLRARGDKLEAQCKALSAALALAERNNELLRDNLEHATEALRKLRV